MSNRMFRPRGSSTSISVFPRIHVRDVPEPRPTKAAKGYKKKGYNVKFQDEVVLTIRWLYEYSSYRKTHKLTAKRLAELYGTRVDYMEKLLGYIVRTHVSLVPTADFVPRLLPAELLEMSESPL